MRETFKIVCVLIFINFFIVGCIDKNATATNEVIEGECSLNADYIINTEPIRLYSDNLDAPTIILLHGKNGSPLSSDIYSLADDFKFDGYNVIMPYMAWSSTQWSGTFCDSISYLNYLILTEKAKTDQDVILAGYDLGATVALSYEAMSNTLKADTLNILAPSHFIHQDSALANAHADSIALAKEMVENNQSDEIKTFYTYNNNTAVAITTTPEIYLSFHDIDEFPNIEETTPLVFTWMLWLAGQDDPLTTSAMSYGIVDLIPSYQTYKEIPGNHTTFLTDVSDEFNTWYNEY